MSIICLKDPYGGKFGASWWQHDPICKLYRIHPETVQHLLLDCNFMTEVHEKVFAWNGTLGPALLLLGRTISTLGEMMRWRGCQRRRSVRRVGHSYMPCGEHGRKGTEEFSEASPPLEEDTDKLSVKLAARINPSTSPVEGLLYNRFIQTQSHVKTT